MIINADAKALEWVAGTELSGDVVAKKEIIDKIDQHSLNQDVFLLPSRLIAKKFVFRLIYGGSAYSYANDPDFMPVSKNQKFWQTVIDKFYEKYSGWYDWHIHLMQQVTTTGKLVLPTGRVYRYSRNQYGEWPRTTILNYPVQGLGADIMAVIRVAFYKRLKRRNLVDVKLISSVHDSLVLDSPSKHVDEIVALIYEVFADFQRLFFEWFHVEFSLPMTCEIQIGSNMDKLEEI